MRAQDIAASTGFMSNYFVGALGQLFAQSLALAFPILGTLFLVSIAMGLMAKAAPQMNLLSMGFPVNLLISFFILVLVIPSLMEAFSGMVDNSFTAMADFFRSAGGQAHKAVGEGAVPGAAAAAAAIKTHAANSAGAAASAGTGLTGAMNQAVNGLKALLQGGTQ